MRAVSPCITTRGCTGRTSRPCAYSISACADSNGEICSRCLIVGNTSSSSPAARRLERLARLVPAGVDDLAAVDLRGRAVGQRRQVEPGVEPDLDRGGRDPAAERDQRVWVVELDAGLLAELSDRRGAEGWLALALVAVDGPAGEHPRAAHELGGGVALDEQHLEGLGAAAQDDHGRRRARDRLLAGVELLSGAWSLDLHRCVTLSLRGAIRRRRCCVWLRGRWRCGRGSLRVRVRVVCR